MSPSLQPSKRGAIDPFYVMEVMKAAAEREAAGGDVIHMEVGQPSTPAPRAAIAAAVAAAQREPLGYTLALGVPQLREAIAKHYRDYYGLAVPAERIIVTTGSSAGFLLAFLAAFDAGDKVALGEPAYPAYRNILKGVNLEPAMIVTEMATRFQPTPADIQKQAPDAKGVLVASPANPTGTMLGEAEMKALVDDCAAKSRWLIVDEIYHGITYHGRAQSVLALTDQAIVINSFSKYFSMTGWRLGWMVVPEILLRPIECLMQNLYISSPGISQVAGIAALSAYDELEQNVARYAKNREILLNELPQAGFDRLAPADGAFYIYADISRFTNDANDFCKRMLAETGIAATPGIDFDRGRGHYFMRFSFAGATDRMSEAAKRLKAWAK
ncbi:MAG TPA: aminotransferase class I/II-fold pyridoxal phosphate-dependent enzyme [Ferrovibrio sp.]|jgi:aspartate/methionine/tyrosine aminotransferase|uniref:pyridoxal phosphate-dependent aminotransferase n=1 Tax=Ferrovibrio sp. TaxID=1917215 RepID=UPI002B4B9146|nr:aminotransferase class I/II-fold pyridoxal phosphate-dependent enzyme [Ferrovibrio sp.]HLT77396.1 aminotransferase class I/II-fold pyridoxal phosphate-dependent enzyme [Ferrovibrio sp.]